MVNIVDVTILGIDKNEESWEIEGEIMFEGDLESDFSATYYPEDDEIDKIEIGVQPGKFDAHTLKQMIIESSNSYDETE